MALSAEPARKAAYSDDLRWRVVWQRIQEKSFREIATNLNISVGTVHNIWQKFEVTGDISKKIPAERERLLDEHHEMLILGILTIHPYMYLSELSWYIHSVTGTVVSNSTICRLLKRHGYIRKKIQYIALQRCEDLRAQFVAEVVCFFPLNKFVWIDECGCSNRDAIRKVGYALRGITPVRTHLLTHTRRISCIAAMSFDGILAVQQTRYTVDSKVFFEFVRESPLQPFDGTNSHSVVVMDNCSIHHVNEVEELFREAGVLLLFLPPYSPDLTPIELLFSKVKYYLKRNTDIVNSIPDPEPVITAAFNSITEEDCTAWAKHCGYGY